MSENRNEVNQMLKINSVKIGLASPETIRGWSHGEVTKPETINYRSLKPEEDGLFCERIFGPSKDYTCRCGTRKSGYKKGEKCAVCGVELTKSSVRRERMGHIDLVAPMAHIWYSKGTTCYLGLVLGLDRDPLERVIYYAAYIVIDPGTSDLAYKQILTEHEYQEALNKYGYDGFRVGMGAEAIKELLEAVNLDEEIDKLREEMKDTQDKKTTKAKTVATKSSKNDKLEKIIKRLTVLENFKKSGNKPEWMILEAVPVIPPDLRPMVPLDGGRYATSDLNDLYRRIISRNARLKEEMDKDAPDLIINNEKRMLQEAVDALIENGKRGRAVTGSGGRPLKSLTDSLKGKQGIFRQNLLGKRVDFSGRSVIVVGPELKIYQCGLPKEMAIELFKPFVAHELAVRKIAPEVTSGMQLVEERDNRVWDVLEEVIREHPVMLNRAPTLHRLSIQAFEPVLVEGKAIKLHPLVCTAFNADFDGDQMSVHLPLSVEAQAECRFLLLSTNNLLKPSDGAPVAVPSQDMILGIYYMTQERTGVKGEGKFFRSAEEANLAYENGYLDIHAKIKVKRTVTLADGREVSGIIETTLGRILFNEIIPQDLGLTARETDEDMIKLEVDKLVDKKLIKKILQAVIDVHGATRTAEVLDLVKAIGYRNSTKAAITVSISDMTVPDIKEKMLKESQDKVDMLMKKYQRGLCTEEERYKGVLAIWGETDATLANSLMDSLSELNSIKMMADSGARGSKAQIKQLAGMRGLQADTSGKTMELPIKSNFREGLDVLEYFLGAHGARKGLSDTALRTADSGYLTRRMVDVCQHLIIRETDCCKNRNEIVGMEVKALYNENGNIVEDLESRIKGRYSVEEIKDANGEVIVKANHMIYPYRAKKIVAAGIEKVKIRSIVTCKSHVGVCAKCYGANMASGELVQVGEAVGIIAAQSIGEPGTQLTMRTFHTGGVAGNDITQGLPRVEEIFECTTPKALATLAEFGGTVSIKETNKGHVITVADGDKKLDYKVNFGQTIRVHEGDVVETCDALTEGSIDPNDLMKVKGIFAVVEYLICEVQKVYGAQGVELADKHIETIIRQMLHRQRIEDAGDSDYLPGAYIDRLIAEDVNEELIAAGKKPMVLTDVVNGIKHEALASESFLSACSFQETNKGLADAAIKGRVDYLQGIKENVMLGRLIPAGTGLSRYRDVRLESDEQGNPAFIPQPVDAQAIIESAEDTLSEDITETVDLQ